MSISSTEEIVAELRAGRMVILVDEEDRENEGDLVLAADFVTPEAINFMIRHARGLVCLTLTEERCDELALPMMTSKNGTSFGTNFTVSIEAAEGVTTGISAADRARTIQVAVNKGTVPDDLVQPGHIFPLRAAEGRRPDACRSYRSRLRPDADGRPDAGVGDLRDHQGRRHHGAPARPDRVRQRARPEDRHHRRPDPLPQPERMPGRAHCRARADDRAGEFRLVAFRDTPSGSAHLALVHGELSPEQEALVRVHQPVSILDLLENRATTHSWTMASAMAGDQGQPTPA